MDTSLIAALRAQTGAGMMEVKKALDEAAGDKEKAIEILRKSGALKAAKKADRATGEGIIGEYIHSNRKVAVLVELLCETDFVARNEQFVQLGHDIAMHIAANNPQYVSRAEVPENIVAKEKEVFATEVQGKPAEIAEKIITGKLDKFYSDVCLLEQKFLKDDSVTVEQYVQNNIAKIGENIQVKRFCRMALNSTSQVCGN